MVQYANRHLQLTRDKKFDIRPKSKVTFAQLLDGSIHILHKNKDVPYEEIDHQVLQKRTDGKTDS